MTSKTQSPSNLSLCSQHILTLDFKTQNQSRRIKPRLADTAVDLRPEVGLQHLRGPPPPLIRELGQTPKQNLNGSSHCVSFTTFPAPSLGFYLHVAVTTCVPHSFPGLFSVRNLFLWTSENRSKTPRWHAVMWHHMWINKHRTEQRAAAHIFYSRQVLLSCYSSQTEGTRFSVMTSHTPPPAAMLHLL